MAGRRATSSRPATTQAETDVATPPALLPRQQRRGLHSIQDVSWQAIETPAVRLAKQVPKTFEEPWAETFTTINQQLLDALEGDDEQQRLTAFMWAKACHAIFLRTDRRGNNGRGRGRGHDMADRFQAWKNEEYEELIKWYKKADKKARERQKKRRPQEDTAQRRTAAALVHICNGTPGKARRVLLSLGTAPMDDDGVVRQLDAKHGKRRRAMRAARRVGNARIKIRLTEKYRKLRRGAGVGPDGFRNEYLRCLTRQFPGNPTAEEAVQVQERCAELYLNNDFPAWMNQKEARSRMMGLIKAPPTPPAQTPDVRPISMEGCRTRAWQAQAAADVAETTGRALGPTQTAIGVKNGMELLNHTIRLHLEQHPQHSVLKFDFKNAYNTLDRAAAYAAIRQHSATKNLAAAFWASHAEITYIDGINSRSEEGVRQGNPLSSLAFCVTIHPVIEEAQAELQRQGGRIIFLMDDGYAVGPTQVILTIATAMARDMKERYNIDLQPPKSKMYNEDPAHLQGVLDQHHAEGGAQFAIGKVTTASGQTAYGIQVAGVPLGDDDYIREHISNKVAKVREGINKTKTALQDVNHQALIAMLAQCFVPTMVYEARIIPPTKMEAHLRELDDVIARTADACIGRQVKLTGRNARRRALPRKLKGGGIRSLGHLAPAAYVGCLCDILPMMIDRQDEEGDRHPGFAHSVAAMLLGEHACDHDNESNRFQRLPVVQDHSLTARSFVRAWQFMQKEQAAPDADVPTSGFFAAPVAAAGTGTVSGHTQNAITAARDEAEFLRLHAEYQLLPWDDGDRQAWLCIDELATQFVGSLPTSPDTVLNNEDLQLGYEMYYNLPCAAVAELGLLGKTVRIANARRQIGAHGHEAVSTATKSFTNWRHDTMKLQHRDIMRRAQIQHACEPKNLFAHAMRNATIPSGSGAARKRQGLRPDFIIRQSGRGTVLADVKCISICPSNHSKRNLENSDGTPSPVVTAYEASVDRLYTSKARASDRRYNGTPKGTIGPLEKHLKTWPPVVGYVYGPFGNASPAVHAALKKCAKEIAKKEWRTTQGTRTEAEAVAATTAQLRKAVGITGVRAHAKLKLDRLRYLATRGAQGSALDATSEQARTNVDSRHYAARQRYFAASTIVPTMTRAEWSTRREHRRRAQERRRNSRRQQHAQQHAQQHQQHQRGDNNAGEEASGHGNSRQLHRTPPSNNNDNAQHENKNGQRQTAIFSAD